MMNTITTVQSVSRLAGGMHDGVMRLVQCLGDQDVQSEVFALHDDCTDSDLGLWGVNRPKVFKSCGPAGYSPDLMLEVLTCQKADMAHGHGLWNYTGVAAYRWATRYRKPYMVSPHGMLNPVALRCSRLKKIMAGTFFEKKYLAGATCIRALSEFEASSIRAYGLKNPICIVPNGVDIPEPEERSRKAKQGKKTLLYLGRLHPGKNLESLLTAWSRVMKDKPSLREEWNLSIAGWGEYGYEDKLRTLVAELDEGRSVTFSGPKYEDDKTATYNSASAFILPSLFEGSPIALLEAWAHGLPVLMTPECNLQVGYEQDAAIKISSDPESMARGIREMLAMTDEQCAGMGEKGRQLVKKQYMWSDVASRIKLVYDWILGNGSQPDIVDI